MAFMRERATSASWKMSPWGFSRSAKATPRLRVMGGSSRPFSRIRALMRSTFSEIRPFMPLLTRVMITANSSTPMRQTKSTERKL